jgi:hypothetical protein
MRFARGHVSGEIGQRIAIGTEWMLVRNVSYLGDVLDISQRTALWRLGVWDFGIEGYFTWITCLMFRSLALYGRAYAL